jgi:quinoprotein glucose dehydrogenase
LFIAFTAASTAYAQKDWPTFGHDLAGARYSTLKQIDTKNVTKLVRAWTYHMNAARRRPRQ